MFIGVKFGFNFHHYGIQQNNIFYYVNINDTEY